MVRCKLCLGAGESDITPTRTCVQRAVDYINSNIHLVKATLTYHDNENHSGAYGGRKNPPDTYGRRRHLRSKVDSLLRKCIAEQLPVSGIHITEPVVCLDLMPDMIPVVSTPVIVKHYLAASDSRLRETKQYFGAKFATNDELVPMMQLKKFEEEKAKTLEAQVLILESCITKMIQSRSIAECSNFMDLIHKYKLPREIRERIYNHLFEVPTQVLDLDSHGAAWKSWSYWDEDPHTFASTLEWLMDPKYVGEKIAVEVEECYNNVTQLEIQLRNEYFEEARNNYPFRTDPHPFNRIRDLYMLHSCSPMHANPESLKKACDIYDQLELISRKNLLRFSLKLWFSDWFCCEPNDPRVPPYDHVLLNTLEMLRKPIYNLKHAGSTVRVLLVNNFYYPEKAYHLINHGDCDYWPRPWWHRPGERADSNWPAWSDSDCFTLSKEAWEKEKMAADPWDPSPHMVDASVDTEEVRSRLIKRWGMSETVRKLVEYNRQLSGETSDDEE